MTKANPEQLSEDTLSVLQVAEKQAGEGGPLLLKSTIASIIRTLIKRCSFQDDYGHQVINSNDLTSIVTELESSDTGSQLPEDLSFPFYVIRYVEDGVFNRGGGYPDSFWKATRFPSREEASEQAEALTHDPEVVEIKDVFDVAKYT